MHIISTLIATTSILSRLDGPCKFNQLHISNLVMGCGGSAVVSFAIGCHWIFFCRWIFFCQWILFCRWILFCQWKYLWLTTESQLICSCCSLLLSLLLNCSLPRTDDKIAMTISVKINFCIISIFDLNENFATLLVGHAQLRIVYTWKAQSQYGRKCVQCAKWMLSASKTSVSFKFFVEASLNFFNSHCAYNQVLVSIRAILINNQLSAFRW